MDKDKNKDEAPADADAIVGDVPEQVHEADEKGYFGQATDPVPNEAYSLESGPDSPPAVPDNRTRMEQVAHKPEDEGGNA